MPVTVTDENTGQTATVDPVELADTIRPWFVEAPAEVEQAITDLEDAVRRREYAQHDLAAFLGLTITTATTDA